MRPPLSLTSAFVVVATIISSSTITTCQAFQQHSPSSFSPQVTRRAGSKSNKGVQDYLTRSRFPSSFTDSSSSTTQLSAVSPLSALASSPLGAITVLASVVVVHEAGHYLAARAFNISVHEFSVGFGPKLAGFEALGNEFNLRALPLGGYVRFPENYNLTVAEQQSKLALDAFTQRRIDEGWTWKEDALNIVTFGQWDERRRKQRKNEAEKAVDQDWKKLSWWQKIGKKSPKKGSSGAAMSDDPEDFEVEYYDDPDLLQNRPWAERAVVLSGGVIFNLILAFMIYFGEIGGPWGNGLPQPIFDDGVVVSQAPNRKGPSDGTLNKGDVILGINGNIVSMSKSSSTGPGSAIAASKQVSDIISGIRETKDGESVTLLVRKEGKPKPQDLVITPKRNNEVSPQTIGVFLSPNYLKTDKLKSSDPVEASRLAFGYLKGVTSQTLEGFTNLASTFLSGKGAPAGQGISGPVGLIQSGTQVVSTKDVTTILLFAAALSVNLGVVNALPVPALDGGQLLFVLAEAITGRKISQRLQENLTGVAVFFLLVVTASATVGDVGRLLGR
eukprot:CAMPEP_0113610590 /NCGR_PEP_ID=MMETSP0017_2-20120614/5108_1 /TAXON_ID=2856 /ORGANISM="Cylindrotheca closterium" /LENGTH=557 /DNA_ID=CAMNT_0000519489 /DNA_START=73 /DNA_END=1746 /DNA_ORIENTATION=- /assembly_acc=CAM_ASM_000147